MFTPTQINAPALLDVVAVALLLQCSKRHVHRLANSGQLPPPRRLGKLARWSRVELEKWIAGGCKAWSAEAGQ